PASLVRSHRWIGRRRADLQRRAWWARRHSRRPEAPADQYCERHRVLGGICVRRVRRYTRLPAHLATAGTPAIRHRDAGTHRGGHRRPLLMSPTSLLSPLDHGRLTSGAWQNSAAVVGEPRSYAPPWSL